MTRDNWNMETPQLATFYCPACNRDLDEEICPECGRRTLNGHEPAVKSLKQRLEKTPAPRFKKTQLATHYCVECNRDLNVETCPKCGRTTFESDDPAVLSLRSDLEEYRSSFLDGHDVLMGALLIGIPEFLVALVWAAKSWVSLHRITFSVFWVFLLVLFVSVFGYAFVAKRIRSRRLRKEQFDAFPASADDPIYLESTSIADEHED